MNVEAGAHVGNGVTVVGSRVGKRESVDIKFRNVLTVMSRTNKISYSGVTVG